LKYTLDLCKFYPRKSFQHYLFNQSVNLGASPDNKDKAGHFTSQLLLFKPLLKAIYELIQDQLFSFILMPLQLPNLDDRTYDDMVQEGVGLIPTLSPEWTNHNSSDPGITLIELFAYFSEILIYRLNRVTPANRLAFLKLLNGPDWQPSAEKSLDQETQETVLKLRECDRAITCEDFERLTLAANATLPQDQLKIARVRCMPRRNLETENPDALPVEVSGHVSVIVVPALPLDRDGRSLPNREFDPPSPALLQAVAQYLEPRRLLTTRMHAVGARYVSIGVHLTLCLTRDALEKTVRSLAEEALRQFLHPLTGGAEGKGWEFGRNVFVSEIYQLLDRLPGVKFVTPTENQDEVSLRDPKQPDQTLQTSHRLLRNGDGSLIGIVLFDGELVALRRLQLTFTSPIH
jgi:Baseplate J-like protein